MFSPFSWRSSSQWRLGMCGVPTPWADHGEPYSSGLPSICRVRPGDWPGSRGPELLLIAHNTGLSGRQVRFLSYCSAATQKGKLWYKHWCMYSLVVTQYQTHRLQTEWTGKRVTYICLGTHCRFKFVLFVQTHISVGNIVLFPWISIKYVIGSVNSIRLEDEV